jgi:hypothetical protein
MDGFHIEFHIVDHAICLDNCLSLCCCHVCNLVLDLYDFHDLDMTLDIIKKGGVLTGHECFFEGMFIGGQGESGQYKAGCGNEVGREIDKFLACGLPEFIYLRNLQSHTFPFLESYCPTHPVVPRRVLMTTSGIWAN